MIGISSGKKATIGIQEDLLQAWQKGKFAMDEFKLNRLTENPTVPFFDQIKKLKLKTFSDLTVSEKVKSNGKDVIMKADQELLGRMAVIAKDRLFDPKEIFSYPLEPIPWALAGPLGEIRKTNKAALLKEITKGVIEQDALPGENFAVIIDAMALVQKSRPVDTFGEFAVQLLESALRTAGNASRVDVVFDVYQNIYQKP